MIGQEFNDDGVLVYDPDDPLAPVKEAVKEAASEDLVPGKVAAAVEAMARFGMDTVTQVNVRAYIKKEKLVPLGVYDKLVREHAREAGQDGGDRGPSVATQLVELAEELYTFGVSELGEPFALPIDGPTVVSMLRGSKTSLRALLAREFFARTGKAATQQALADALLVLEGMAQDTEESRLYLRAAQHDGDLWLDLGDPTGRAVQITRTGWSVESAAPVLFKRTTLTGPLPEPQRGGSLDGLWEWLNVAEDDRPLVAAVLVSMLFSDQPHVVLAILGEQGTGKTTVVKVLTLILDPGPVPVRKPPRDADSWVTQAAGSWVVGLDNLSDIPPWLSDSLCRASTGDGDVRRKLYSDSDYAVFAFRRCVIFNGIDVGAMEPDLADRALPVTLDLIPDEERRDEESFWPDWRDDHPLILGAVLDLAVKVLQRLPSVDLAKKPRMADYARILAAVDAELGTDALTRYASQAATLAADGLSGDPLAARIQAIITSPYEGTSAGLLELVKPHDPDWKPPKEWPKDARAVTGRMRRLAPAFRKTGWTIEDLGRGGHDKQVQWKISPPAQPEASRDDARQRPQDDASAGDAGDSGRYSGTSQVDPQEKTSGAVLCNVCGEPLAQALIDAGFTDHGEAAQ